MNAGNLKKELNFDEKPDSMHFVNIDDEDNKKKEVDIKIVPPTKDDGKKGAQIDLTISQDMHKQETKHEEFSIGMTIKNWFSSLIHLW